ncbi:MAG: hypothetical protein EOM47_11955 [Bacteroidia bacterium]|nr:hypothetical protein [Bacteroidia bacterium]
MKRHKFDFLILSLTLFFVMLFLVSCAKDKSDNKSILRIEKLLPEHADSAFLLLDSLGESGNMKQVDQAAHQLLTAYALFLSNDSAVRVEPALYALEYYKGTGLLYEEGLSNFLYGHALLETGEIDQGIIYLKKAISLLNNTNEYNLLGLANYYLGYNYSLDAVYEKALSRLRLAAIYFEHADEQVNRAYAYREIANAFDLGRCPVDSALVYFDKSQNLLLLEKDTSDYYDVRFYRAITLLNRTTRFCEAKNDILEVYRYFNNDSYYHNKLSFAYARCGQADSAMYFYQLSKKDTANIYSKMAVSMAGAYAYMAAGDYQKAVETFLNYDLNKTLVFDEAQKNQLYRIDKGYDLSEKEKENATLRVKQQDMVVQFALLTIIVLVLAMAFLIMMLRRKREQAKYREERLNLLASVERKRLAVYAKVQSRMEAALRLSKLDAKYRLGMSDPKLLLDEILSYSVLSESEWTNYIDEIDMVCSNHISALAAEFPSLTNADKIVIALTSVKIDITDSCIILGMNKNTMYRRRNTIKERLGLDKTVDFDAWILGRVAQNLAKEDQNALISKLMDAKKK